MITDKKSIIKIKTETDGYVRVTVECQNRINGVKFTVSEPSDKQTSVDLSVDGNRAQAGLNIAAPKLWSVDLPMLYGFSAKIFRNTRTYRTSSAARSL